jgi:hypothetical protein
MKIEIKTLRERNRGIKRLSLGPEPKTKHVNIENLRLKAGLEYLAASYAQLANQPDQNCVSETVHRNGENA